MIEGNPTWRQEEELNDPGSFRVKDPTDPWGDGVGLVPPWRCQAWLLTFGLSSSLTQSRSLPLHEPQFPHL